MKRIASDSFPFIEDITHSLVSKYGRPTLGNKKNPFNELIYIILSTRTDEEKYQLTYTSLRKKFKSSQSLLRADPEEISRAINIGGLQHKKAEALSKIVKLLKNKYLRVTLAPLKSLETQNAEEFLRSLPGVSVKTARCVLLYSLNRAVFPVDTHCFRIMKRIGWINKNEKLTNNIANRIHDNIPEHLRRDLHVGLVVLGRKICNPYNPQCSYCPISDYCSRIGVVKAVT